MSDDKPVLQLKGLKTFFHTDEGTVKAVNDVTFDIHAGMTLGLVGESGSGKSVTSLTVMQLLPEAAASIEGGEIECRVNVKPLVAVLRQDGPEAGGNRDAALRIEPIGEIRDEAVRQRRLPACSSPGRRPTRLAGR